MLDNEVNAKSQDLIFQFTHLFKPFKRSNCKISDFKLSIRPE